VTRTNFGQKQAQNHERLFGSNNSEMLFSESQDDGFQKKKSKSWKEKTFAEKDFKKMDAGDLREIIKKTKWNDEKIEPQKSLHIRVTNLRRILNESTEKEELWRRDSCKKEKTKRIFREGKEIKEKSLTKKTWQQATLQSLDKKNL